MRPLVFTLMMLALVILPLGEVSAQIAPQEQPPLLSDQDPDNPFLGGVGWVFGSVLAIIMVAIAFSNPWAALGAGIAVLLAGVAIDAVSPLIIVFLIIECASVGVIWWSSKQQE